MNNRIMAALFALTLCLCLFIGVAPAHAEAATYNPMNCPHEIENGQREFVARVPATCTEEGTKEHWICKQCNSYVDSGDEYPMVITKKNLVIAATGHKEKYESDETHHWTACENEGCDYETDKVSHVFVNGQCNNSECAYACEHKGTFTWVKATDDEHYKKCDACLLEFDSRAEHAFGDWQSNTTHHWRVCTDCSFEQSGAHGAEKAFDAQDHWDKCPTCDFEQDNKAGHAFSNGVCSCTYECKHDAGSTWTNYLDLLHYAACDICKSNLGNEDHDPEWKYDADNHWQECSKCEYTTGNAKVQHDYQWKHEGLKHWKECECGSVIAEANHSYAGSTSCKDGCGYVCTHEAAEKLYFSQYGHREQCVHCLIAYGENVEHTLNATSNDDGTHTAVCADCDYEAVQNCADFDEDGDHRCDECGVIRTHDELADIDTFEIVDVSEATCLEDGCNTNHLQCTVCGLRLLGTQVLNDADVIIPKLEHEFEYDSDEDQHWTYCKNGCQDTTDKVDHVFVDEDNEDGTHTPTCVCGATEAAEVHTDAVKSNGACVCSCGADVVHTKENTKKIDAVEATCENDGNNRYRICEECGGTFAHVNGSDRDAELEPFTDIVISKTGHDWKYVGFLANSDNKVEMDKCQNCDEVRQHKHVDENKDCYCDAESCAKLLCDHSLVLEAAKEATCIEQGHNAYYRYAKCINNKDDKFEDAQGLKPLKILVITEKLPHSYGEWTHMAGTEKHERYCTTEGCDAGEEQECYENQYNPTRCGGCDRELKLKHVAAVAATCEKAGTKEYWQSTSTGRMYADEGGTRHITKAEEVPALGHDWEVLPHNANARGANHTEECANCKQTRTAAHVADETGCFCVGCGDWMSGHALEWVSVEYADCTHNGIFEHQKCSCGKLFDGDGNLLTAEDIVWKAYGHDWSELRNSGNNHYRKCLNVGCDKIVYSEHSNTVSDPQKGNYHQYTCACGHINIETHYNNDGDNKCDKCEHEMVSQSIKVTEHDQHIVVAGNPDKVNPVYSWWRNFLENLNPGNTGGAASSSDTSGSVQPPVQPPVQTPDLPDERSVQTPEQTPDQKDEKTTTQNIPQAPSNDRVPTVTESPAVQSTGIIQQVITVLVQFFSSLFG